MVHSCAMATLWQALHPRCLELRGRVTSAGAGGAAVAEAVRGALLVGGEEPALLEAAGRAVDCVHA